MTWPRLSTRQVSSSPSSWPGRTGDTSSRTTWGTETPASTASTWGAAVILRPPAFDHIGPGFFENDRKSALPTCRQHRRDQRFLRASPPRPLGDDEAAAALAWNIVVPSAVRGALLARARCQRRPRRLSPLLVTHGTTPSFCHRWPTPPHRLPSRHLVVCTYGVGHMPFWEAPHRFDRELADLARAAGSPLPGATWAP